MLPNPTGQRVIILAGQYLGSEGVCLGRSTDGIRWMISPDNSDEITPLIFDTEFGILVSMDN